MSFDLKISNGDLVIKSGELKKVIDSEKLIQDILKICLTPIGANPINPGYGSYLSKTLIGSPLHTSMLSEIGKSQINTCLENLKLLQRQQIESFQRVTADEQLAAIKNISVVRNAINPTLFDVLIGVVSKGFKPISTEFRVTTL